MKILRILILQAFVLVICESVRSQVEYVDIGNPVYGYLKEMQVSGYLSDYSSAVLPLSRREIAKDLLELDKISDLLPSNYKGRLEYYKTEFEYDMNGSTGKQNRLIDGSIGFSDSRQNHLYFHTDSSSSVFANAELTADYRYNQANSAEEDTEYESIGYGRLGLGLRGTLFGQVGFDVKYEDAYKISSKPELRYYIPFHSGRVFGKDGFRDYTSLTQDAELYGPDYYLYTRKHEFIYNNFAGHLRYATGNEWFSAEFGRIPSTAGFGYIDKLFLSDNTYPFDAAGITLRYKSVSYKFFYGSVNGDSSGLVISDFTFPYPKRELSSKNIVGHYLGVNFSKSVRLGLWESVIVSEQPFSFTYLNPVSFLTSADLSSGDESTTNNNSMIGIEAELTPANGLSFQASMLIDDLTFETLFSNDSLNENKYGWQIGGIWTGVPGLSLSVEYTHLDPFVYSHRSNKSTFTNRGYSLGHALPPNSDELAVQLRLAPTPFIHTSVTYRQQRSGAGVEFDGNGNLKANYGGYITYGLGDAYLRTNNFLDGERVNRYYLIFNGSYEFVRQVFIDARLEFRRLSGQDSLPEGSDILFDAAIRLMI